MGRSWSRSWTGGQGSTTLLLCACWRNHSSSLAREPYNSILRKSAISDTSSTDFGAEKLHWLPQNAPEVVFRRAISPSKQSSSLGGLPRRFSRSDTVMSRQRSSGFEIVSRVVHGRSSTSRLRQSKIAIQAAIRVITPSLPLFQAIFRRVPPEPEECVSPAKRPAVNSASWAAENRHVILRLTRMPQWPQLQVSARQSRTKSCWTPQVLYGVRCCNNNIVPEIRRGHYWTFKYDAHSRTVPGMLDPVASVHYPNSYNLDRRVFSQMKGAWKSNC
ncbi:hypothetical protein K438DRAFT_1804411 [Mycena galopus ATCC 62051]|nr:hypothetical protein K438DRAFT_1804411 [Mycena galopus ATCC 62051]